MNCKFCGKEIRDTDKFCHSCGHPTKGKNKKKYSVILGGVVTLCVIMAVLVTFVLKMPLFDSNILATQENNIENQDQMQDKTEKQNDVIEEKISSNLKEVLTLIEEDGKWGYINALGEIVIEPMYDQAWDFSEGLAPVCVGEKWGYINKKNEVVIDIQYDSVGYFSQGWSPVKIGELWGYINAKGENMTSFKYEEASPFSEGVAKVYEDGVGEYLLKWEGDVININTHCFSEMESPLVAYYSEGLAQIYGVLYREEDGHPIFKYGYVDKKGYISIAPIYDDASAFSEGLASVQLQNKYGYINGSGSLAIDFQYDYAGDFSEGIAAVMRNDRGYLIDTKGDIVLDSDKFSFEEFHRMKNGMISAFDNDNPDICYIINRDGEILFEMDREKFAGYGTSEEDSEGVFVYEYINPGEDYSSEAFAYITKNGEVLWTRLD